MRKLVTFRTVQEIRPMDADKLELALIDGWQVVVNKGDFTVGSVGTYFEVDSFLPERPEFEFLRASSFRKMGDESGFKLKTIRLRSQLSQGLLLPPALLGLTGNEEDPAELLGVKLWEPPIPAQLAGTVMGMFPSFIPKTDQERVQNLTGKLWGTGRTITYTDAEGLEVTKELPAATKRQYDVSEKLDGSSMTVYDHEGVFGVCSRNLDLKEDENNSYWKAANRHHLRDRLKGRELALQAELVGEGIQGNPYKLKDQFMYVYDIYDITRRMYLSPEDRLEFLARELPDVKTVPLLARHFELPETLDELLAFVQGKSALNPQKEREGLVFKEEGESVSRFSFKGISNSYLLKQKD